MWFLYQILFGAVFVLLTPYFLWRMRKRGGYRRGFMQRFAVYSDALREQVGAPGRYWLHAVSVGELFVAQKCMEQIRLRDDSARFVISVTTSTAHALAKKRLGEDDLLIYFPIDMPWIMRACLRTFQPAHIFLMECELWPNLIRLASRESIPVHLVNGRMSDSSFRGYRRMRWMTRRVFPQLQSACMQSKQDRARIVELGADPKRTQALGSAKFDVAAGVEVDSSRARAILATAGMAPPKFVLLGGSTWPGEEALLARIYSVLRNDHPELALVLVPRHAERAHEIAAELDAMGCSYVRRSLLGDPPVDEGAILLVDTTGELMAFYQEADLVFVGKSLTCHGGQNPLEPAALSRPTLVGPHMENFPVVMDLLLEDDALLQISDEPSLLETVKQLLQAPDRRSELGRNAGLSVASHQGVIEKTLDRAGIPPRVRTEPAA